MKKKFDNQNNLYKCHIGIIGDEKCGKTCLIKAFLNKSFTDPKQNTILNSIKLNMTLNDKKVECLISEINLPLYQNDKFIKKFIKTIDVFFICYEITDNDTFLNMELIKKYIGYISYIKNINKCMIYVVGCKLDYRNKGIRDKSFYIFDKKQQLTDFGKEIQNFVIENKVKSLFLTSALLNYNVSELFESALMNFFSN